MTRFNMERKKIRSDHRKVKKPKYRTGTPLSEKTSPMLYIYVVVLLLVINIVFGLYSYNRLDAFRKDIVTIAPFLWQNWEGALESLFFSGVGIGLALLVFFVCLFLNIFR